MRRLPATLVAALALASLLTVTVLGGIAGADWSTYHAGLTRQGRPPAGTLLPASASWTSPGLDGMVYGEPLVVGTRVYVATENDSVYALDATTGQVIWRTNLGTSVPLAQLPCGDIDPLGITGTPVIDPSTGSLYVVAEERLPSVHHQLFRIDTNKGAILAQRSADPPGLTPLTQQQRPALTLANGKVYWNFGGLAGDCGTYHGWVVGSSTSLGGPLVAWHAPTVTEGAVWATPGASVDGAGNLYVTTGNGSDPGSHYDEGNSIIKLGPNLNQIGAFAPTNWGIWSQEDADLGSTGALLLPGGLVFAIGKQQVGYLIDGTSLAGTRIGDADSIVEQTIDLPGCAAFGGAAYAAPYIYVPCANGVQAVRLDTSVSPPTLTAGWKGPGDAKGSPIVADGAVWDVAYDTGRLYALDTATGGQREVFPIGHARHFTSVGAGTGRVFVPTDNTVQAFAGPSATTPTPPSSWTSWSSTVPSLAGGVDSGPAAASWAANRLDVFATAGGAVRHTCRTDAGWCGWEDLGGTVQGSPAAVSWGANRLDVFARGSDGELWHRWFDGATWQPWEPLGGRLTSAPAVASWGPGRLDVLVRGTDGQLWHQWFDGGWSGWEPDGGQLGSAPTAVSWNLGRLDVFVAGTDGQLWHQWFDGRWSGWEPQGGRLTSAPAVGSWATGRLDAFGRGTDGQLWHKWFDGRWSGWEPQAGTPTSDPAAVSSAPNRIDVFARDGSGQIAQKTWA